MLELNKKVLMEEIECHVATIHSDQEQMSRLADKIKKLSDQRSTLDEKIRGKQRRVSMLLEAVVIADGIPDLVARLRGKIVNMKRKFAHEDMLVSKQTGLTEKIAQDITKLKDNCNHPFVIGYNGYKEFYSMDRDNAYQGYRLCIVCGSDEYSQSCSSETFKILDEHELRLIKVASCNRDERMRLAQLDIWQPLEPIVKEVFLDRKIHDFFKRVLAQEPPR